MKRFVINSSSITAFGLLLSLVVTQSGCNLFATLMYNSDKVPAKFEGLEENKVAVLCVSGPSFYSEDSISRELASKVEDLLTINVEKIEIIPQQVIDDWKDRTSWDSIDYREAGKGVDADLVVAVDLSQFEIQDNPSMYKGNAKFTLTVYDMNQKGKPVFQLPSRTVNFPKNGSNSSASVTESEFKDNFLTVLSHRVARNFYQYDVRLDMMLDETYVAE